MIENKLLRFDDDNTPLSSLDTLSNDKHTNYSSLSYTNFFTMQFFKSLYSLLVVLACVVAVTVAKKNTEEEDQALKDLYTGMAGLKEAANNPAILAQLMRDLQVSTDDATT